MNKYLYIYVIIIDDFLIYKNSSLKHSFVIEIVIVLIWIFLEKFFNKIQQMKCEIKMGGIIPIFVVYFNYIFNY